MIRVSRCSSCALVVLATVAAFAPLWAAEEAAPATAAPAATTAPATKEASSLEWLEVRGTMTTDDVIKALGITPTAEQRAQIEKAVQKRNAALQEANADLSKALQKTLAANDGELAKKVEEESERQRMAKIRSRQPGRYQGIKKDKEKPAEPGS